MKYLKALALFLVAAPTWLFLFAAGGMVAVVAGVYLLTSTGFALITAGVFALASAFLIREGMKA